MRIRFREDCWVRGGGGGCVWGRLKGVSYKSIEVWASVRGKLKLKGHKNSSTVVCSTLRDFFYDQADNICGDGEIGSDETE